MFLTGEKVYLARPFVDATRITDILDETHLHCAFYRLAMQGPALDTVELSVPLSVCPSHAGTVSKRSKLGSRNLHRRIAQG